MAGRGEPTPPEGNDWFEASWNPTAGCSVCSPGCEHCHAMRIAARLARIGGKIGARYAGLTAMARSGPRWTGEMRVAEDLLAWPLRQRRPRRIGVDVMSDLFHENLGTGSIDLLHAVMASAHWHRFLVLTKRAERMRSYYSDPHAPERIAEKFDLLSSMIASEATMSRASSRRVVPLLAPGGALPWPLPNLWLGVSVEDQQRIGRIRDLLQTPAAIRWVCFEPLIERVQPEFVPVGELYFDALTGGQRYAIDRHGRRVSVEGPAWRPLDWVVVGGEIGADARPMQARWARRLRDGCLAARVPFFFRRWGEWAPAQNGSEETMTRIGVRAAGRRLDGRTWGEFPAESA